MTKQQELQQQMNELEDTVKTAPGRGYSYLADDGINRYVLKQIHHEPCDYYQFYRNLKQK